MFIVIDLKGLISKAAQVYSICKNLIYSVIDINEIIFYTLFSLQKACFNFAMAFVVFFIYDNKNPRKAMESFFALKQNNRIRKTLAKSAFKVYMAINFQICTNVCIGHTVYENACVCFRDRIKNTITFN